MAKYNDDYYKNILAKLLRMSLTNTEPAKALIEDMFEDDDFKDQAICLCEAYMKPEYRESTLISKTIDVRALPALVRICRRDKLGIIPLDFTGEDDRIYENGDKINVLVLSMQVREFERAALEACAVSGVADEILRKYADAFAKKIQNENPMMQIEGVSEAVYNGIKREMEKLPPSLRFTLFPDRKDDGKIDVGFFLQTEQVMVNNGKRTEKNGPYMIPKIASVLLACSLLENPDLDMEYEESEKKKKELLNAILEFYYGTDEPFFIVPATVGRDGSLNVFMDRNVYYDVNEPGCPDYLEYNEFVNSKMSGFNHTAVVMTEKEFSKFRKEVTILPKMLSFYKKAPAPEYMPPEKMRGKEISERMIDVLNRKREQILLVTDDFNGKNMTNIENYISGTVHEIVMREDEDYTDWLEKDEILDGKEMELLSDLEEVYNLSYVYDGHDKVSELINAERQELEGFRSVADHAEVSR